MSLEITLTALLNDSKAAKHFITLLDRDDYYMTGLDHMLSDFSCAETAPNFIATLIDENSGWDKDEYKLSAAQRKILNDNYFIIWSQSLLYLAVKLIENVRSGDRNKGNLE